MLRCHPQHAPNHKSPSRERRKMAVSKSIANSKTPISASTNTLWQKARSLPKWSFQSQPITTLSKSFSMTKLPCASIWNRVSRLPLSLSVGKQENINPSNAGDLFSALTIFPTSTPNPQRCGFCFCPGKRIIAGLWQAK